MSDGHIKGYVYWQQSVYSFYTSSYVECVALFVWHKYCPPSYEHPKLRSGTVVDKLQVQYNNHCSMIMNWRENAVEYLTTQFWTGTNTRRWQNNLLTEVILRVQRSGLFNVEIVWMLYCIYTHVGPFIREKISRDLLITLMVKFATL
jgi:hypothetical protein